MTRRRFFHLRTWLSAARPLPSRRRIVGLAVLVSLASACGAQSSTDPANPALLGQKLQLRVMGTGVVVSGDPGAVPAGARVDVVNTSARQTATATAAEDGSFELQVEGSSTDEYRVYAASAGQTWYTRLTSAGAAEAEAGLAGLEFLLESATGFTPVPSTTARLSFKASELSFSAGCNAYSGTYSLCDGKLCVSRLGGTEIGCETALQTQDGWIADFLQSSPGLTQAGPTLTLAGAEASLEFLDREVADADRPLTGRTWTIDTFIENGAASSSPSQASPTLEFGSDGTLQVFTTCNSGRGSYTRNGQTLTLASVALTALSCGATGSVASEDRIGRVLADGEVTLEIDARRLTLMRGALGLSATTE